MIKSCVSCVFAEVLVREGETYTFLDPFGDEVVRVHGQTVLQCKALPPVTGTWPQVSTEDWCGYFKRPSDCS